jgi:chromosome segregation ATPase
MNTTNDTPAAAADHLRYEIAQLEKMRQQIFSDMEALRQQEQNLRSFEARLRGSQPPVGATVAPFTGSSHEIEVEREKLSRQRALLEAERRSLTDERLAVREEKTALAQYAEALKQREAWVELRERELKAKSFAPPPAATKKPASTSPFRFGFNEVPFAGIFGSNRRSA